mgnify:CR=1 FL=1
MNHEYLLEFLEKKDIPTVHKLRHAYLTYYGLDQQNTYVLKEGVVKTSIILRDGREFNISYLKAPDIISLLRDEVSQYTSAPFNVRIESETAVFYKIPRVTFWEYVNEDKKLQDYINAYYREQLSQAIYRQQLMTMNGKTGAVCAFLYLQIEPFGKKMKDGILIDFQITNDDIAGFCGISTRNSVNRILRGLRENGIIFIADQKILIKDKEYLEQYFNDIKFIAVDRNIAKTDAVEANNAILVDDFKENLIDWENHGGIGIHFDENLKKSKFKVINRLDELINVFSSQE